MPATADPPGRYVPDPTDPDDPNFGCPRLDDPNAGWDGEGDPPYKDDGDPNWLRDDGFRSGRSEAFADEITLPGPSIPATLQGVDVGVLVQSGYDLARRMLHNFFFPPTQAKEDDPQRPSAPDHDEMAPEIRRGSTEFYES